MPCPAVPADGVWVPTTTFFSDADEGNTSALTAVDTASQVAQSIFLIESGVTGLVLLGSTGEAIHMSRAERVGLIRAVKDGLVAAGHPEAPIMAGVLVNGIEEARSWLADAKSAGADYGLVLVPGYFGSSTTQEGIVRWLQAVAQDSPLPIVLYNYPGVTNGVTVAPETYRTLAQLPNVVGVKMSHTNYSHHLQVALDPAIDHSRFKVYSGLGQHSAGITLFGCAGVVDGLAAFYPRACVRLWQLTRQWATSGEVSKQTVAELQQLQYAVCRGCEYIAKHGVIGMKELGRRVTGFGIRGGGRAPLLGTLSDAQWQDAVDVYLKPIEEVEAALKS